MPLLGPNDLPFAVSGERCAVVEKTPKGRTEGGLYIPDTAKERYYSGRLVAAGLAAMDKLHDHGFQFGDEVEFGRYAGLREAWDHVIEGDHTLAPEAYDWKRDVEGRSDVCERYVCQKTGAVRVVESLIIINVDDLLGSKQLAERLRDGEMRMVARQWTNDAGFERTSYVIERKDTVGNARKETI